MTERLKYRVGQWFALHQEDDAPQIVKVVEATRESVTVRMQDGRIVVLDDERGICRLMRVRWVKRGGRSVPYVA